MHVKTVYPEALQDGKTNVLLRSLWLHSSSQEESVRRTKADNVKNKNALIVFFDFISFSPIRLRYTVGAMIAPLRYSVLINTYNYLERVVT